jgi:hypothetical protein
LGRSFLFHPEGTRDAIVSMTTAMREAGKNRAEIIDHLALLRSRSQSYSHVAPVRIYENPNLVAGESL